MSLPGYSAEASVYRSFGHYRSPAPALAAPSSAVAVPQLLGNCGPCLLSHRQWCCVLWPGEAGGSPPHLNCFWRHCWPRILAPGAGAIGTWGM